MSRRLPVLPSATADCYRFAVVLCAPLPMLTGISTLGNDRILVRVGHPEPLVLVRSLQPHYAGMKEALELGLVELLDLSPPTAEVLRVLAAAELGAVSPQTAGPRRLALVR